MPNDLMCERELSLHEASFLAHFLHLHRALWRCDVVLESDVCLTYCVPLADSLCSFVRVQHVCFFSWVFIFVVFLFLFFPLVGRVLLVFRKELYGGGDCMYVYECI